MAFVISPNGLGHAKRALGWLPYLLEAFPTLQLHLAMAEWQAERLADVMPSSKRVHLAFGYTEGAVRWHRAAAAYVGQDLLAWRQHLATWEAFQTAEVVISDNLVEVLALRPDALLMGSFLWGPVLKAAHPEVEAIRQYCAEEQRLLHTYRPTLLCVGDLVMPEAAAQTGAVKLPWMTTPYPSPKAESGRPTVAFLGGATPSIQASLQSEAEKIAAEGTWQVLVPERQWEAGKGMGAFDFSAEAWHSLDAVVCRPGVGTLTDAVRYRVPILAIEEPENLEMLHNGRQVEALGLGRALPLGALAQVSSYLQAWETPEGRSAALAALAERPVDGYARATDWLRQRLERGAD